MFSFACHNPKGCLGRARWSCARPRAPPSAGRGTVPPFSVTAAAVASTSSVAKYVVQRGGSSGPSAAEARGVPAARSQIVSRLPPRRPSTSPEDGGVERLGPPPCRGCRESIQQGVPFGQALSRVGIVPPVGVASRSPGHRSWRRPDRFLRRTLVAAIVGRARRPRVWEILSVDLDAVAGGALRVAARGVHRARDARAKEAAGPAGGTWPTRSRSWPSPPLPPGWPTASPATPRRRSVRCSTWGRAARRDRGAGRRRAAPARRAARAAARLADRAHRLARRRQRVTDDTCRGLDDTAAGAVADRRWRAAGAGRLTDVRNTPGSRRSVSARATAPGPGRDRAAPRDTTPGPRRGHQREPSHGGAAAAAATGRAAPGGGEGAWRTSIARRRRRSARVEAEREWPTRATRPPRSASGSGACGDELSAEAEQKRVGHGRRGAQVARAAEAPRRRPPRGRPGPRAGARPPRRR